MDATAKSPPSTGGAVLPTPAVHTATTAATGETTDTGTPCACAHEPSNNGSVSHTSTHPSNKPSKSGAQQSQDARDTLACLESPSMCGEQDGNVSSEETDMDMGTPARSQSLGMRAHTNTRRSPTHKGPHSREDGVLLSAPLPHTTTTTHSGTGSGERASTLATSLDTLPHSRDGDILYSAPLPHTTTTQSGMISGGQISALATSQGTLPYSVFPESASSPDILYMGVTSPAVTQHMMGNGAFHNNNATTTHTASETLALLILLKSRGQQSDIRTSTVAQGSAELGSRTQLPPLPPSYIKIAPKPPPYTNIGPQGAVTTSTTTSAATPPEATQPPVGTHTDDAEREASSRAQPPPRPHSAHNITTPAAIPPVEATEPPMETHTDETEKEVRSRTQPPPPPHTYSKATAAVPHVEAKELPVGYHTDDDTEREEESELAPELPFLDLDSFGCEDNNDRPHHLMGYSNLTTTAVPALSPLVSRAEEEHAPAQGAAAAGYLTTPHAALSPLVSRQQEHAPALGAAAGYLTTSVTAPGDGQEPATPIQTTTEVVVSGTQAKKAPRKRARRTTTTTANTDGAGAVTATGTEKKKRSRKRKTSDATEVQTQQSEDVCAFNLP